MILHVDLDAFFASVEQRDNPKLKGKPVVVGGSFTRGVVSTASYEARKYGVHSGMPFFRARQLCPHANFMHANFAKYEVASSLFLKICEEYSPLIEQTSIDELYMDVSQTTLLWPNSVCLARRIMIRVQQEIGITCSIGVSMQKTVAKIASGYKKPNGITVVKEGNEIEFLAPLPLKEFTGCGPKTRAFLNGMGIKTIGDFAKMDKSHAQVLLGKHGLMLWNIANGNDSSQVVIPQQNKSVSHAATFPFDTREQEFIKSTLLYLCDKTISDLRRFGVSGKCVTVTVRTSEFETQTVQHAVKDPITTLTNLYETSRKLFYGIWDGAQLLRLIGVGVSHFALSGNQTLDSKQLKFSFHLNENFSKNKQWEKVGVVLDNVRKKHGFFSLAPAKYSLSFFLSKRK